MSDVIHSVLVPLAGAPRWIYEVAFAVYAVVVTALVIWERRRPTATLAWILALVFLPLLGMILYLAVGRRRVRRSRKRRRQRAVQPIEATRDLAALDAPPPDLPPIQRDLVRLAVSAAAAPVRRADRVVLLDAPERIRRALFAAVEQATQYVHLEFYIWKDDAAGRALTSLLVEKARAGVAVRVLYDYVGSMGLSPRHFDHLVAAGGQVRPFAPLRIPLPTNLHHLNFRNHRKIAVVDDRCGFLGGANVGEEYLGAEDARHAWRDLMLDVHGDAVLSLNAIFLDDWLAATGQVVDLEGRTPPAAADADGRLPPRPATRLRLRSLPGSRRRRLPAGLRPFPSPEDRPPQSEGALVQIIPSGPDGEVAGTVMLQVTAAIFEARSRVWIATAYFVPDEPTLAALQTAALRGVDVRILVPAPEVSDQPIVAYAARSYYDDLLAAGCKIYEFVPGMLHAKCLIADEDVSLVGSANMDVRSFYVNYEVTAIVYDETFTRALAETFERYLGKARAVTPKLRAHLPIPARFTENAARLLSPLL